MYYDPAYVLPPLSTAGRSLASVAREYVRDIFYIDPVGLLSGQNQLEELCGCQKSLLCGDVLLAQD